MFGFSLLQGAHQEAQKSTMVTFPRHSLRLIVLPCGFGPEKSELHLVAAAGAGAGPGIGAGAAGAAGCSI